MMIWHPFLKAHPVSAVITQCRAGSDGKPGSLTVQGVATFDTKDGHLFGKDTRGNTLVVVPLSEVALAVIDRT